MKCFCIILFSASLMLSIGQSQNYTQFVNPLIGTGGHGHTFPGATQPFAMVQLSPDTRIDGSWDGCSGYHYSDTIIYGFSHTHLSGTGCSDYGDIAFLPSFDVNKLLVDSLRSKPMGISFSHKNERAAAGYYQVILNNGVKVELSATERAGIQKYTYNANGYACVTLNLKHRDELLDGRIKSENASTFSGKRSSAAWAKNQILFFYTQLSKVPNEQKVIKGATGDEMLLLFFTVKKGETIIVKTALSNVDEAGAKNNLEKEMPDFDFNKYLIQGSKKWNDELSKIKVYGSSSENKIKFYSALYHCMIHPSIINDVDNRYRGRDGQIHSTEGKFNYYSVFSLWDTYRALHPLLALIDTKRTSDFIQTFIMQFDQAGRLPIWELWENETNCMIGYHAVSVIWDAYNKGIRNFDVEKAFEAMKSIAMENSPALNSYNKYGYVRADDDAESVSKTLEYAYDDWCIAEMAQALHKDADYEFFIKRSTAWRNVYDPITGFMRARKNGTIYEPFSPFMVDNNYTEANSYQYSFYVPHDMASYTNKLGGVENLDRKLDQLFTVKSSTEGREQADITGLIGQYAQGNEPSHHIAYLYSDEAKKNKYIHYIMDSFYRNSSDGLIGNEDCGQMSAWYVWAAMGLYPVCPGKKEFAYNEGVFDSVLITTASGPIMLRKNSTQKIYDSRSENDLSLEDHFKNENEYAVPFIYPMQKIFKDTAIIKFGGENSIFYSLNHAAFVRYDRAFIITDKTDIQFYSIIDKIQSKMQQANFYKLPNDREVILQCSYNPQYQAGGAQGLIDGVHGDINWRKGDWQGYQSQDFNAIIKFDQAHFIKSISATFLQDQGSWIFFPSSFAVYTSMDGVKYELQTKDNFFIEKDERNSIKSLESKINKTCKYVKIVAANYGKLPQWHAGAGGDAFIFIDEVEVEE